MYAYCSFCDLVDRCFYFFLAVFGRSENVQKENVDLINIAVPCAGGFFYCFSNFFNLLFSCFGNCTEVSWLHPSKASASIVVSPIK